MDRILTAFLAFFFVSSAVLAGKGQLLSDNPHLDSSLQTLLRSADDLRKNVAALPADMTNLDRDASLAKTQISLSALIVLLSEDDLKKPGAAEMSPQFTAMWHHAMADCQLSLAEFYQKTGEDARSKSYAEKAIPNIIDVNAYFMDHSNLKYDLFGREVEISPAQQQLLRDRAGAFRKKKKK